MKKSKLKRLLTYVVPFVALLLIFGLALACSETTAKPEEVKEELVEESEEEVVIDEPEEVPIEEPKAEETVVKGEPFTKEDCYENLDISLGINIDEAKNFLGEPQSEEKDWDEFQGLNRLNVYYHGLELIFEEINGDYLLKEVSIYSSDYEGPRGIRIGDNTISVLEKFLLENREVLVVKPYYDEAYLYFIDEIDEFGFNKWGVACFDRETGVIEGIHYFHAVPHSCWVAAALDLKIEDDIVTEIHYWRW